jgi:hypothetical protein
LDHIDRLRRYLLDIYSLLLIALQRSRCVRLRSQSLD